MWGRFDDNFPHHPKARRAGVEACWLFVCGVLHCNRFATDGAIAALDLDVLYPSAGWTPKRLRDLAAKLVEVGLWEVAEGGWRVHDYADYQREAMRDARDERRKWEADRKARQREAKKAGGANTGKPQPPEECPTGTWVGQSHGTSMGQVPPSSSGTGGVTSITLSQPPVPSRPVPSRPEENSLSLTPPAPATSKKPPREKRPATDPPPFSMAEAFEALATESLGRFVAGTERDWTKGVRIAVAKGVRAYPDLALWRRLGRWLASGGDAFRGSLGPAWAASNALADAMARAGAWEAQGGGPVSARGATPPRPPLPPRDATPERPPPPLALPRAPDPARVAAAQAALAEARASLAIATPEAPRA